MISIHALLAESDLVLVSMICLPRDFYPRSPCGERPSTGSAANFSSDFYPRSPCGERHDVLGLCEALTIISIHALLAESDPRKTEAPGAIVISIHALLAESDRRGAVSVILII